MNLLHVRHATSIITYAGLKILVDPVFAKKEASPAIPMTPNRKRNPLVDLSTPIETLLDVDVLLVTHTHGDHFDSEAMELLDKKLPLICQSDDESKLSSKGFQTVIPVKDTILYKDITITRVYAQHGIGITEKAMGVTSGYILQAASEPTVYFTGDTIYNETVKNNILQFKPDVLVMNAGSPKFLNSDRIVMNIIDLENTMTVNPNLVFVVVHLETFNHCIETRDDIHEYFSANKLKDLGIQNFYVPKDNEFLTDVCFPYR